MPDGWGDRSGEGSGSQHGDLPRHDERWRWPRKGAEREIRSKEPTSMILFSFSVRSM